MATWAVTGKPDRTLFERAVELDQDSGAANYAQCLAVALLVIGRKEEGINWLNIARERIGAKDAPPFSCWRYRRVPPEVFVMDLEQIRLLADDAPVQPEFLKSVGA